MHGCDHIPYVQENPYSHTVTHVVARMGMRMGFFTGGAPRIHTFVHLSIHEYAPTRMPNLYILSHALICATHQNAHHAQVRMNVRESPYTHAARISILVYACTFDYTHARMLHAKMVRVKPTGTPHERARVHVRARVSPYTHEPRMYII